MKGINTISGNSINNYLTNKGFSDNYFQQAPTTVRSQFVLG